MKRYVVPLEQSEREQLSAITHKGSHSSQKVINALIPLNCDEGRFNDDSRTGETIAIAAGPGSVRLNDYEYRRLGPFNIFIATEPSAGRRVVGVTERRAKTDWTQFLNQIRIDRV